jgi:GT2 family glycosyltransferase
MTSVLAIVLTHDAPAALDRCLAAIDAQTRPPERVLVVDNASVEAARAGSRGVVVDVRRSEQNTGPAGGHALGLEVFLHSGADLAWVMDDDCIPDPDCLDRLLTRHAAAPVDVPVFPYWIDARTGQGTFKPAWCGFVVSRRRVAEFGLPRTDFVWWAEDTEYLQWRVHVAGLEPEYALDAIVVHDRVRGTATKPVWKVYYEVRNTVYFRLYVQRKPFRRFKWLSRSLLKLMGQILLREDRKGAKLAAYGRGVLDGLTGRLGVRVPLGD